MTLFPRLNVIGTTKVKTYFPSNFAITADGNLPRKMQFQSARPGYEKII